MPALAASTAAGNAAMPAAFAPGRVLIGTRAGLSDEALAALLAPHGAKARRLGRGALHLVELPAGASASAVRDQLARNPLLKFAELDRMVPAALTTNDPYLGSEWHLTKVGASTAWDSSQGSGVTIAVLDTGVDATHPDLTTRIVPGWNFVDNNANTADVNGHGTAVAGAATASLNNSLGVAGLAGQARLMPVRIADANAYTYWSTLAQGLTWAADQGARVANISFVGVATSQAVQDAANYMRSKGGLVVVAAGNNGVDEGIAPTSSMLVVSATDSTDTKTSWSSYGSFVTIAAPGQDIWTTTNGGGYQAWWGTSMATPVVSGVIGLMMSAQPSLSNSKIESLLYSTSTDLGAAGRDSYYGYGRVNAAAAVSAALGSNIADTVAPSVSIGSPSAGATVSGLVSVSVNASDNVGVSRVELRVNGSALATDTSAPYAFSWDASKLANGSYTLSASAFDAAGNVSNSSEVQVNVSNPTAVSVDTTPPVVALLNPANGAVVSGTVSVSASASDNSGAAGISQRLYIDGKLVASATGAALNYSWNTRKAGSGIHTLQVVAKDAAGNSGTTSVKVSR